MTEKNPTPALKPVSLSQMPRRRSHLSMDKPSSYFKGSPSSLPVSCVLCERENIKQKNALLVGDGWFCKKCAPTAKLLWEKEHPSTPETIAFPVKFNEEDRAVSLVVGDPIVSDVPKGEKI